MLLRHSRCVFVGLVTASVVSLIQDNKLELSFLLSPFANNNCLIVIKTYVVLDITAPRVPILIQNFIRQQYKSQADEQVWSRFTASKYINLPEIVDWNQTFPKRCGSKHMVDDHIIPVCVEINFRQWILETKPISCVVVVDAFYPIVSLNDNYLEYPFSLVEFISQPLISDASFRFRTVPVINILVLRSLKYTRIETNKWISSSLGKGNSYHNSDPEVTTSSAIFFIVWVNKYGKCFQIYNINIKDTKRPLNIPAQDWGLLSLRGLSTLSILENRASVWKVYNLSPVLHKCNFHLVETKSLKLSRDPKNVYAYIILQSLGNFSFQINKTHSCEHPGQIGYWNDVSSLGPEVFPNMVGLKAYTNGSLHVRQRLGFNISSQKWSFLSCGKETEERLSFDQLAAVFDGYVWLSILLSFITILILPNILLGQVRRSEIVNLMDMFKLFVEQGTPFSEVGVRSRWILGSLLLVGLLMSNAYKNSNVYNLTLPKSRIPFESLNQIRTANFTILAKLGTPKYINLEGFGSSKKNVTRPTFNVTKKTSHGIIMISGKTSIAASSNLLILSYTSNPYELKELMEISSFSSGAVSILTQPIEGELSLHGYVRDRFLDGKHFTTTFLTKQNDHLTETLARCENTAILLHHADSVEFKRRLKRRSLSLNIDTSKEGFMTFLYGVRYAGLLTPRLFQRVTSLEQSGIVGWFEKRFDWLSAKNDVHAKVAAAKMSGNISILFMCLAIGLILSGFVYGAEILVFQLSGQMNNFCPRLSTWKHSAEK